MATWPEACSQGRLVDIEQLELVNAMVADITDLKDDFIGEFLLNVEIPFLYIRRFQVVLNTRDVERRLRSARAEDGHADSERKLRLGRRVGQWHNCVAGSWSDWILREAFLKIVEWNCVVVDAKPGTHYRLFVGDKFERGLPGQGDTWTKITFWSVIDVPAW